MNSATLIRSMATLSLPQYIIADYEYAMGSDSTAFISIELPALYTTEPSYRQELRNVLTGKSYAIDLCSFSFSCDSDNFDIKVLNRGSETLINTIYDVLTYSGVDKSSLDLFDRFIIRNEDNIITNKIYLQIINNSLNPIGNLLTQLTFVTLQDR